MAKRVSVATGNLKFMLLLVKDAAHGGQQYGPCGNTRALDLDPGLSSCSPVLAATTSMAFLRTAGTSALQSANATARYLISCASSVFALMKRHFAVLPHQARRFAGKKRRRWWREALWQVIFSIVISSPCFLCALCLCNAVPSCHERGIQHLRSSQHCSPRPSHCFKWYQPFRDAIAAARRL